jgi:tetratricopeptide (TPR) repeat protein
VIKKDEPYPKDKIIEIDGLLEDEANKKISFSKIIKEADLYYDQKEFDMAKELYLQAYNIMPGDNYAKYKIEELFKISHAKNSTDDAYSKLIKSADLAYDTKYYTHAMELYQSALKIKPQETYPKKRINELDEMNRQNELNKMLYASLIQKADDMYDFQQFHEARVLYEKAHRVNLLEKYPVQRMEELDDVIRNMENIKEIGEIDNELIEKMSEKKFMFSPISQKKENNYIKITATNLSNKKYKILVFYGMNGSKSGGFELNAISNKKPEEYRIRIGSQDNWVNKRNNWISIHPVGGDLEVNRIEIIKGDYRMVKDEDK